MKYLFGPVPSRRYGRSLGVDLSVPKTCTLNCRFCQLGPTKQTTVERTLLPTIESVLEELNNWYAAGGTADFITASGSGEPTLHRHFGELFRWVKNQTPFQSLLLSNGTLFTLPDVRRDAALADVVKVSLHAWDQDSFQKIMRPHPSLRFSEIVDGYCRFRDLFSGRLDVEVFIVPGINDQPEQAEKIAALINRFSPDTITLNTAVRPPAEDDVHLCPGQTIEKLRPIFGTKAFPSGTEPPIAKIECTNSALINLVDRHPVSLSTLARTFSLSEEKMREKLRQLETEKQLQLFHRNGEWFAGPVQE